MKDLSTANIRAFTLFVEQILQLRGPSPSAATRDDTFPTGVHLRNEG